MLGTSPDGFAPARMGNESVGAASTLVIRRVTSCSTTRAWSFPEGTELRKGVLAKQVLAARKGEEPAIGLPVAPWVADHAAHMVVRARRSSAVSLVGSWDDLDAGRRAGGGPGDRLALLVADAAIAGLAGVLAEQIRVASSVSSSSDASVDDEGSG